MAFSRDEILKAWDQAIGNFEDPTEAEIAATSAIVCAKLGVEPDDIREALRASVEKLEGELAAADRALKILKARRGARGEAAWSSWRRAAQREAMPTTLKRIKQAYCQAGRDQPSDYDPLPKWETLAIQVRDAIIFAYHAGRSAGAEAERKSRS